MEKSSPSILRRSAAAARAGLFGVAPSPPFPLAAPPLQAHSFEAPLTPAPLILEAPRKTVQMCNSRIFWQKQCPSIMHGQSTRRVSLIVAKYSSQLS